MSDERIDTDAIRARHAISDIVGRRVKLRRAGREFVGLCPFHNEKTASFYVNDSKAFYHCFGCGAHGDVLDFIQQTESMSFVDAVRWLGEGNWPEVNPIERSRAVARDSAERLAKIADAQGIWDAAAPVAGTPASAYLASRGIGIGIASPYSFRFARTWAWKDYETGECDFARPALIGAVRDVQGDVVGIQRIFVRPDGLGKAAFAKPKRSLGRIVGCAVRIGPDAADAVMVCEGPEDGLTLSQARPDVPVWVALGTGVMPSLEFPAQVHAITIAGDNNVPGRAAVAKTAAAYVERGLAVTAIFPRDGYNDFNDEYRAFLAARRKAEA